MVNLFYLLLFLLPSNLAKHFVFPSSYVSGIKVDYLIPALYLTDILIILLLIFKPIKKIPKTIIVFLLCLLPSVIFANSFWPAVYKYVKIIELVLFGLWIYQHKKLISQTIVIKILSFSVLFQSLLAITQWFKQSFIFGYWFFGEQPYSAATPGIDKIIWLDGSLKIPPLGTFPHPNVLAGFLVIAFLATAAYWLKRNKIIFILYSLIVNLALFLTFSLSAWLALLLIGIPLAAKFNLKKYLIYYGSVLIFFSLIFNRLSFLAPESSFSRRSQLASMAIQMFKNHPLVGVGLNNFTVVMDNYGLIPATTRWLQPVHNIYLLILSETGIIGVFGFLYFLLQVLSLKAFKERPYWISFLVILFLGLFDHYPFTLQQGLLLLILTLQSIDIKPVM
ncbi:MAG: O-antigen ligase family protein [Candidatus Beckwithbacteria bacterium]|nr:O-antigen ligase family protein [Candidatus Beckwithbacteria bacterium]